MTVSRHRQVWSSDAASTGPYWPSRAGHRRRGSGRRQHYHRQQHAGASAQIRLDSGPAACRPRSGTIVVDARKSRRSRSGGGRRPAMETSASTSSTGLFTNAAKAVPGRRRQKFISAPATDEDITIVWGVNTTTSMTAARTSSPMRRAPRTALRRWPCSTMSSASSRADDHHPRLHSGSRTCRTGRWGCTSRPRRRAEHVPTSTGAAKAIGLVMLQLKGKLDTVMR